MDAINILDARNNLSRLISAARDGDEVIIAKRGVPVARLIAVDEAGTGRTGAAASEWLSAHRVPQRAGRTVEQIDERIADERSGWE